MKKPIKTKETVGKGGQILKDIKPVKGSGAVTAPADNKVTEGGDNG